MALATKALREFAPSENHAFVEMRTGSQKKLAGPRKNDHDHKIDRRAKLRIVSTKWSGGELGGLSYKNRSGEVLEKRPQDFSGAFGSFADRRTVLKAALIASSASVLGAGLMTGFNRSRPYKFIYDRDYAAAADFARSARDSGLTTEAVGADVTSLWYNDLYHHWRQNPATIAGLTTLAAAYCIEVLAGDAGLRTVFRGVHSPSGNGRFEHTLSSVRPMPILQSELTAEPGWGATLSTALRLYPAASEKGRRLPIDYAPALHPTQTAPLVSWLIEPIPSA